MGRPLIGTRRSPFHGMTFLVISILIAINTFALVFYFSFIHLNLVFAHSRLPTTQIPYYDSTGGAHHPSLHQVDRYHFEWWVFASDALRVIPPVFVVLTMLYQIMHGPSSIIFYNFIMIFIAVVDAAKLIYRGVQFAECGYYQLCRNYDTGGSPSKANTIWVTMFWFNMGFLVLHIIYSFIGSQIKKTAISYDEIQYKSVNNKKNDSPTSKPIQYNTKRLFV